MAIERLNNAKLWLLFFIYTFCVSAFVQIILLPNVFPDLYAGNGLLNSSFDSSGFHELAVYLTNRIHTHGWSAWQLRPGGQSPAGIASIFYFFILPDPRVLIPLSAALHASAALVLVNLMNLFIKNKNRALICILPFLVFPSNLQWTAQWHRDGLSILGMVLILQGMVLSAGLYNYKIERWIFNNFRSIIFYLCGIILVWIARPYLLGIIEPFIELFFSLLFLLFLSRALKKEISWRKAQLVLLSMLLIIFALEHAKTDACLAELKESPTVLDNEAEGIEYETEEAPELLVAAKPISEKLPVEETAPVVKIKEKETEPSIVKDDARVAGPVPQPEIAAKPISEKLPVEETAPIVKIKEKETEPSIVKDDARVAGPVPQPEIAAKPISEKLPVEETAPIVKIKEKETEPMGPIRKQGAGEFGTKKIKVKVKKLIKKYYIEDHWKRSSWLPLFIENKAYGLAQVRRGFRFASTDAKSNIDTDIGFSSVKDMLTYLPRAVQIVFLAPFPHHWFGTGSCVANSLMRRISAFEMIITYFALIFLFYAIWYWRKRVEIWIILTFCAYMMLIYGLAICNIGTLYRMRYLYMTIMIAFGIAGFIKFLENKCTK